MQNDEIYQLFIDKLCNRTDVFYQWRKGASRYSCVYRELAERDIIEHLSGEATLALPALSKESTCKWLAFDIDDDTGKGKAILDSLSALGWSAHQDSSRSCKEGHIMMFFDSPLSGVLVRRFALEILGRLGLKERKDVEIFPAQAHLKKVGNGLRMPIGVNQKASAEGARGWFEGVDRAVPAQLDYLRDAPLNSSERLIAVATRLIATDQARAASKFDTSKYERQKKSRSANFLELFRSLKLTPVSSGYATRCPACATEGHDKAGNNLWISTDGTHAKCMYNNGVHRISDVLKHAK